MCVQMSYFTGNNHGIQRRVPLQGPWVEGPGASSSPVTSKIWPSGVDDTNDVATHTTPHTLVTDVGIKNPSLKC